MRTLIVIAAILGASPALAQTPGLDQLPGQHFEILAEDLPLPSNEPKPYVANSPRRVARGDHVPLVPEGFTVTLFADGLPHPRRIAVLADGVVLVVQQQTGQIIGLEDRDGDGVAERGGIWAQNLPQPFGLTLVQKGPWAGDLLMTDPTAIYHLPIGSGRGQVETLTGPDAFGDPAGHITRAIAIHPETNEVFVSVGSMSNIAEEPEVKATIQRFDAAGTQTTFARGLRNATGLAIEPTTGDLYAVVMERDTMGDALVPDFFAKVSEGDDFGWPYQYAGGFVQPGFTLGPKRAASKLPEVMFEAHSAPMDVIFLPASWPEAYRGDAIVALKGSSNREVPTGYKLVRIDFENGAPVGGYDNFATGFWVSGTDTAEVWGRPAALGLLPDGGLLVGDDFGGTLWKIMPPTP